MKIRHPLASISVILALFDLCLCVHQHQLRNAILPSTHHAHPSSLLNDDNDKPEVICLPFGECEPCPKDALHEPFCKPFGNRRLLHCVPASDSSSHTPGSKSDPTLYQLRHPHFHPFQDSHQADPSHPVSSSPPDSSPSEDSTKGETPAWESCGRIPAKERADFWEFVLCNVLFAGAGLVVLGARSKKLRALQARRLAARIGWGAVGDDG